MPLSQGFDAEAKTFADDKDETDEAIPNFQTDTDDNPLDTFNDSPPKPRKSVEPERVIIVVDGNEAIFSREYVLDEKDAEYGGLLAAGDLKNMVKRSVSDKLGSLTQYWIYARIDRPKVAEALANEWNIDKERMRRRLDLFVAGFNASTHRVQMVDTHIRNPEVTYAQFQWFVCDELRMPQTKYIVFTGCHNENYLRFLEYWIGEGFREKLILLQAYDELAQGFKELDLPIINDSLDLFMKTPPRGLKLYSQSMMSWNSHASNDGDHHLRGQRGGVEVSVDYDTFTHFPCPLYYLSDFGCGHEDCPYTHDYPLSSRQLRELARDAKMEPCLTLVQGRPCPDVQACIWGHQCPFNDQCRFLKRKCWFCAADTLALLPGDSDPKVGPTGSEVQDLEVAVGPAESAATDPDNSDEALSDSLGTMHEKSDDSEERPNDHKL
ncbi:hypothetical protein EST38_g8273 [Candolleomyces aberdarensis]|uniref:DUF7923 domain-containing protein n=1 Tax=Candolleomyces aberdarensis TaxID=2316362 RepID=A0A4Q2DF24_9AGAR|nr:hypothetical protein EST38_g8273 [Candolleomyces aberdarensis]